MTHDEDLEKIVLSDVFLGLHVATTFIILQYGYHRPIDLAQEGQGNNNEELQNHTGNENPAATSSV